jgi:hypothetical protein
MTRGASRVGQTAAMHNVNSLIGMRSYQQVRHILSKAVKELTALDTLPD